MKRFAAQIDIDGTAEAIWEILTDAASYPSWDPNMNSIEGTIGLNEKLVLHTTISKRTFTVSVKELVPNRRMVWSSGIPLGLFKGVRTFELAQRDGSVHFTLEEVFSGPLSPLFGRFIPDLNASFAKFAQGLKAEVESQVSEPASEDDSTDA